MNILNKKQKVGFKDFLNFYTKFRIPWGLYIMASALGIVYAEITFKIANCTIQVNKGELYNKIIISYVLLNLLSVAIVTMKNQSLNYGDYKIILRSRGVIWNKILHMKIKEIDNFSPAGLVSGITNDSEQACIAVSSIFEFVASAYGFGKACWILYSYNSIISKYMITLIPFAIFVFWLVGHLQQYTQRRIYAAINQMTIFFSEHVSAVKYVKAQAMEEIEIQEGFRAIDERYKADILNVFLEVVMTSAYSVFNNLTTIFLCVFGSRLVRNGQMELTGINSSSTYMEKVNLYLSESLTQYQNIRGSQGALTEVNRILKAEEEDPSEGEEYITSKKKDIVFDKVEFGYTNQLVIKNVSFTLPYGKTLAIVGNNGSGKTTLMKLMQGFYEANSGTIKIGENELGKTKLEDIRKQFSYIIQNDCMFSGSVKENIIYGCEREVTDEEIVKAAKRAGAHEFIMSFENGYNTILRESGMNLSGGQRKRLSFARAFLSDKDYFLLDEAGANLDSKTYSEIYESVKEKMRGKTVIFIAHEIEKIMDADYILVLTGGEVEAFGTPDELIKSSKTYRDYVSRLKE
ncbi:MAG: ABC transporter ATP-binding protein/permease [Lachnospiraceae bacterium]|nr:ABC transporter ATP-binding protein/permease [Lachnospiraceae bacterium]